MIKRSIVTTVAGSVSLPENIIDGAKTNITTVAAALSSSSITIQKGILLRLDSLGAGTYVKIGNATTQSIKMLNVVGEMVFIDWIDNLNKIYLITDAGNTTAVSYNGA